MTRLSRKESQEVTRDRLRDAAAREFARRGVSAASIDTIAESAGFSRGAFYSNYRSKHELLLELLEREQKREVLAWRELIAHAATLDAALPALAERFDAFLNGHASLLAVELRLEAQRNPEFGEAYAASSAEVFDMSAELGRMLVEKAGGGDAEVMPLIYALRGMAVGLGLNAGPAPAGAPSGGETMALFLKRMLAR
jgi:AcrR family transcriptional regulator